jgi:hypothetical protein
MRIYKERNGAYFLIDVATENAAYDGIANVMEGPTPSLGSCRVGRNYMYDKGCKRVQWSELPEEWQVAFQYWLGDTKPEDIRGFWLVGNQPVATL